MSKLSLTLACADYDRTRPLLDGSVQPEGIELVGVPLRPGEIFFRMSRYKEFQVSEMSLASYTILKTRGDCPFVAIPAFPSRMFRHSCIYVNTNAGIESPQDLAGKSIGMPEYQMTAAVYARGMLHHEYGVAPESVLWMRGGLEEPGHQSVVSYKLPEKIKLEAIPPGKVLSRMLEAGEVASLITPNFPSTFLQGSPTVKRLFPDFKEVETDYFRRTGIFPIMHTVVIREDVYKQHPWVAQSLFKAFLRAKEQASQELYEADALKVTLPWVLSEVEETRALMGADLWPYGVEPNRVTLEALTQYLVEQGLAERALPPEELFAPNTLDHYRL